MDITVTVTTRDNTPAFKAELRKQLEGAVYASGLQIEKEAKQSILSGPKTGRIYQRRTVTHQASAPGESPASDTGRLVNSIHTTFDRATLTAKVIAGTGVVFYAWLLEIGTRLIAARPFMHPAAEKSRPWILDRFNQAVDRAIQKFRR